MKSRIGILLTAVLAAAAMLGLTACGSDVADEAEHEIAHLSVSEWSIEGEYGEHLALPSGEARIEIHNDGQTVHQLAIWEGGEVEGDDVHGGNLVAKSGLIEPGEVGYMTAEFTEGTTYLLTCPIAGHTQAGMHEEVTAQAVAGHGPEHEHEPEHEPEHEH